jgi:hypothetical protein
MIRRDGHPDTSICPGEPGPVESDEDEMGKDETDKDQRRRPQDYKQNERTRGREQP